MELVRTALRDGVDGTAGESALANVERSDIHLNLLNRFHRNGLCTSLTAIASARSQTEHVVVHRTVNLERVVTVVHTGKRHHTAVGHGQLRIETCHIGNTVCDGRHVVDLLRVDTHCRTSLGGIESALTRNNEFFEHSSIFLKAAREVLRLTQEQVHIAEHLRLVTDVSDFHRVRTTHTHTLYRIATVNIGHCTIDCSRRKVLGCHRCTNDFLTCGSHLATDA